MSREEGGSREMERQREVGSRRKKEVEQGERGRGRGREEEAGRRQTRGRREKPGRLVGVGREKVSGALGKKAVQESRTGTDRRKTGKDLRGEQWELSSECLSAFLERCRRTGF